MSTTAIPAAFFDAVEARPRSAKTRTFEMVKAFADRIFSVAKHITQNDDDATDVLIETFLRVCPDLWGSGQDEKVWLRLVSIAVTEAFSKLCKRGEGRFPPDQDADPCDDVVIRELSVWGDGYPQCYSPERTNDILEHGLRSLDPMCRTVFVLRDIEEIPVKHIARIVKRSVAAVEVCLLRARLQLREALARQMRQVQ